MTVWLLAGNTSFVLGAAIGALTGLYILLDIVFRGAPLRIASLLAMTLLLAYNLGALNSWLTVPRAELTIAEYFVRDPAALARAMAACLGSAALLLALGELYERPIFGREFRIRFDNGSAALVVVSAALLVGAYAAGNLGYMGIAGSDTGHVSPISALTLWWSIPAFAYSVCATLNTTGMTRWLVGVCTIIQGLALVPFGRRIFAFAVLLAVIAARLGSYRSRLSLVTKAVVATLGIALVLTASVAFLYLRVAGWGQKGASNFGTRVSLAVETLEKRSPSEVFQLLSSDASTRTFDIGYFSDLLEASQHSSPLLGQILAMNLQSLIPSALSADKFGLTPYGEEQLVDMKWGFSYADEANSVFTAGAADFGITGVLIYPLLVVLLMRVTLEWAQFVMPTVGAVIVCLAFVFEMLQAEEVLIGYFTEVRNALILAALIYLFQRLPRFQLRHAD